MAGALPHDDSSTALSKSQCQITVDNAMERTYSRVLAFDDDSAAVDHDDDTMTSVHMDQDESSFGFPVAPLPPRPAPSGKPPHAPPRRRLSASLSAMTLPTPSMMDNSGESSLRREPSRADTDEADTHRPKTPTRKEFLTPPPQRQLTPANSMPVLPAFEIHPSLQNAGQKGKEIPLNRDSSSTDNRTLLGDKEFTYGEFEKIGQSVEHADDYLESINRQQQYNDKRSSFMKRYALQLKDWTHLMSIRVFFLIAGCYLILRILSDNVRYGVPPENWWVRPLIDVFLAGWVSSWPAWSLKRLLGPLMKRRPLRRVRAVSMFILMAYIVALHTWLERSYTEYLELMRLGVLLAYMLNVCACAFCVDIAGSTRFALYIIFTYAVPFVIVPLYTFLIGPYVWQTGNVWGIIMFRFVFHPIFTSGIVSISRTLAVFSSRGVHDEKMWLMLTVSQIVSTFYGRVLIAGIHDNLNMWFAVLVVATLELLGYAFRPEIHKATRKMLRYILCIPCRKQYKEYKFRRIIERANSQNLTIPGSDDDDDDEDDPPIQSRPSTAMLRRTLSLTDMGIGEETEEEKRRFERVVIEGTFTQMMFEHASIFLAPLMFVYVYSLRPDESYSTEALQHANYMIVVQSSVEIVVDFVGVFILELRGIDILKTTLKRSKAIGTDSWNFINGFVLMLLSFPMYTMLQQT